MQRTLEYKLLIVILHSTSSYSSLEKNFKQILQTNRNFNKRSKFLFLPYMSYLLISLTWVKTHLFHVQSLLMTNKCILITLMYFYCNIISKMFWPLIHPPSGWFLWYKNTTVIKCVTITPHSQKPYNFWLKSRVFGGVLLGL
jgi:hypothetical protein